ncbi:MAG: hypothetical protein J5I59_10445 [Saprospiraceae bacterium]|nr:hypothetical protein [Saprospiraceae bacterium]
MSRLLLKYKYTILGIFLGALAGYAYYHYVGCSTGTCFITSNPWNSTVYGALLGGLFFTGSKKNSKNNNQNEEI